MIKISESDWKCFKRVHGILLERFSQRFLDELAGIMDAPDESAHDRYRRVVALTSERRRECGRLFHDFRRSTAMIQLIAMRSAGLLSDDDLKEFSEETRTQVKRSADT